MLCCIVICRFMQKKSQRHNDKGRTKSSLQNMYLSFYCQGSKRVTQGFTVRGSWRLNKDCNILTSPAPPDTAMCRPRSPDAQPGARGLSFLLAFSTTS